MTAYQRSPMSCVPQANSNERLDACHRQTPPRESVDNQWLQRYYHSLPMPSFGNKRPIEDYRDAYVFGLSARTQNKAPYFEVCDVLEETWKDLIGMSVLDWETAEPVIQHAYNHNSIKQPRRLQLARQAAA